MRFGTFSTILYQLQYFWYICWILHKISFQTNTNMQWFSLVATIILWENQKTTSESQEVTGEKLHGTMSGYGNKSRLMV